MPSIEITIRTDDGVAHSLTRELTGNPIAVAAAAEFPVMMFTLGYDVPASGADDRHRVRLLTDVQNAAYDALPQYIRNDTRFPTLPEKVAALAKDCQQIAEMVGDAVPPLSPVLRGRSLAEIVKVALDKARTQGIEAAGNPQRVGVSRPQSGSNARARQQRTLAEPIMKLMQTLEATYSPEADEAAQIEAATKRARTLTALLTKVREFVGVPDRAGWPLTTSRVLGALTTTITETARALDIEVTERTRTLELAERVDEGIRDWRRRLEDLAAALGLARNATWFELMTRAGYLTNERRPVLSTSRPQPVRIETAEGLDAQLVRVEYHDEGNRGRFEMHFEVEQDHAEPQQLFGAGTLISAKDLDLPPDVSPGEIREHVRALQKVATVLNRVAAQGPDGWTPRLSTAEDVHVYVDNRLHELIRSHREGTMLVAHFSEVDPDELAEGAPYADTVREYPAQLREALGLEEEASDCEVRDSLRNLLGCVQRTGAGRWAPSVAVEDGSPLFVLSDECRVTAFAPATSQADGRIEFEAYRPERGED